MKGKIINNWENFDVNDKESRLKFSGAVQYFVAMPAENVPPILAKNQDFIAARKELRAAFRVANDGRIFRGQEFGTAADFPATVTETLEKYHAVAGYDNGWERVFDTRDYTGTKQKGFNITNVSSGITFAKTEKGDTIDVYQMSGTKSFVYFDRYGAGLSIDRMDLEDGEYWTVEDNIIAFRNEAFRSKAAVHYALIEAVAQAKIDAGVPVALQTVPWQASPDTLAVGTRGYLAQRDAATINLACQRILIACRDKGYGIAPDNVSFVIVAPLQLRARMRQAMTVNYDLDGSNSPVLDYSVSHVNTMMLQDTERYFVCLPGLRSKSATKLNLTIFDRFDELSFAEVSAGWQVYGAAIGDLDQFEVCEIAP